MPSPHCCSCFQLCLDRIRKLGNRKFHQLPRSLNMTCAYVETVIKTLLGGVLIPPIEVLHADAQTLLSVNSLMLPFRPEPRLIKDIDLNHHEVILTSDAAFLPHDMDEFVLAGSKTLCLEIKPKQGFILESMLDQSKFLCRYCRNQFCKSNDESKSSYCPCDLFSGDKSRMMRALVALLETPQNNLRLFLDGLKAYHSKSTKDSMISCLMDFFSSSSVSSDSSAVDSFLEIIYQTLTFEFPVGPSNADSSTDSEFKYPADTRYSQRCNRQTPITNDQRESAPAASDAVRECDSTLLSPSCVLGRILSVQLLDKLGVDGTLPHYDRLVTFLQEKGTDWDFSKGPLVEFIESLNAPLSVTQSAQHYDAYLTSLVAKDCSIMITLAPSRLPASQLPSSVPHHVTEPVTGVTVLFSVAIVDLDPKPFDRVKQHWEENQQSLKTFYELSQ